MGISISVARDNAAWLGALLAVGFGAAACETRSVTPPPPPEFSDAPVTPGTERCERCEPWEHCVAGDCACRPACEGATPCAQDGCGGLCACPADRVPTGTGEWVSPAECFDTCASTGFVCGELCNERCGDCQAGTVCADGRCAPAPRCDGTRCEDGAGGDCPCAAGTVCDAAGACLPPAQCHDDCAGVDRACGEVCGELCGACSGEESCLAGRCSPAVSCVDCPLALRLVARTLRDGDAGRRPLTRVSVALDFEPAENEPRPRLADLRLRASRPARLLAVEEGPALTEAGKSLYAFPPYGRPWSLGADGAWRLLVAELTSPETLARGRIATLEFELDDYGPVRFSLLRREQTFAPPAADGALQSSPYDHELVVTR